jgi:hypothetical protein
MPEPKKPIVIFHKNMLKKWHRRDLHVPGEPTRNEWAFPIVVVRKKDGKTRICTELNAVTQQDAYPMPRIDDILDNLGIYYHTRSSREVLAGSSSRKRCGEDYIY